MRPRFFALAALLLAAAPCLAADQPAAKRDDSASEKLGMKLSLQCWTFNQLTFFETVDKAKGLGVKYLEIYPGQKLKPGSDVKVNRDMSDETIAEIKKKLADAGGLKLVAYGVDGIPTDEAAPARTSSGPRRWASTCSSPRRRPTTSIDKLCKEYNIRMALHNHPTTWPPDEVLKACKGRGKLIGSCSDTGHWMRADFVPVDAQEAGRPRRAPALQGPQRVRQGARRALGHRHGRPQGHAGRAEAPGLQGLSVDRVRVRRHGAPGREPAQVRRVLRQDDGGVGEIDISHLV